MTREEAAEVVLRPKMEHLETCPNCHGVTERAGEVKPTSLDTRDAWRPMLAGAYGKPRKVYGWACALCDQTGLVFTSRYSEACAVLGLTPSRGAHTLRIYSM